MSYRPTTWVNYIWCIASVNDEKAEQTWQSNTQINRCSTSPDMSDYLIATQFYLFMV